MSFLGMLNMGEPISKPIDAFGNAIDKIFTSDEEREQAKAVLLKLEQQPAILQAELNKIEAGHRSLFVAGWRPMIGWTCGLGLAYAWLIRPLIGDIGHMFGHTINMAEFNTDNMMQLVIALLGLGGLRTYEKIKGKAK